MTIFELFIPQINRLNTLPVIKGEFSVVFPYDGKEVEFDDGWALVRYSNTGPNITARFEGKTEEIMNSLKDTFLNMIDEFNK